jgi:hypothetical protein
MLDAHQHFWKGDRGDYSWMTPDPRFVPRWLRSLVAVPLAVGNKTTNSQPAVEAAAVLGE